MPDKPRGGPAEGPDRNAPSPGDDLARRTDLTEPTQAGIAPEARADPLTAEVDSRLPPAEAEPEPSGLPFVREPAARKAAVPGIGGGQIPPPEYGVSPKVKLSRPLARHQPEPKVGDAPVPPYRRGEGDD